MLLRRHHHATAAQPERAPRHRAAEPPAGQDTEPPAGPPAGNASREQWADYRVAAGHLDPDQAETMSRDDLRDYQPS